MAPEERPARTDHMPIITLMEMGLVHQTEPPRLNYWAAEWEMVRGELEVRLNQLEAGGCIDSKAEFYSWLNKLTQAITEMIDTK